MKIQHHPNIDQGQTTKAECGDILKKIKKKF
jgi:hypothetical protein